MGVVRAQTVYLLHGLLGSGPGHFAHQIRAWQDSVRLVPIDLPGHGCCRVNAGPRYFDTAADYVLAVMGRFGRGHLVAASYLGGTVAVHCLRRRPYAAHSLVLTGFVPGVPAPVVVSWAGGFEALAGRHPELAVQYERMHGPQWRDVVRVVAADLQDRYEDELRVEPGDLAALGVPVLLANGSVKSDERAAAQAAAGYGPQMHGVVVEGAGHLAGHDRPAEFNAVVERFWDAVDESPGAVNSGQPGRAFRDAAWTSENGEGWA